MSTTVTPVLPETAARADGPPMSVGDAIRTRRTIRSWLPDQPVAEALINELLEAALWAPSACNMQLWDFVVVTDEATRQQLEDAVPFANQAPVLIFVCYNTRFSEGSFAHIQGASASIMNMLLQGHALGLGGFWQATIHDRTKLHTVLRLPEDVEVLATVLIRVSGRAAGGTGAARSFAYDTLAAVSSAPASPRRHPIRATGRWRRSPIISRPAFAPDPNTISRSAPSSRSSPGSVRKRW